MLKFARLEQYAESFEQQGFTDLNVIRKQYCKSPDSRDDLLDTLVVRNQMLLGHTAKLTKYLPRYFGKGSK